MYRVYWIRTGHTVGYSDDALEVATLVFDYPGLDFEVVR